MHESSASYELPLRSSELGVCNLSPQNAVVICPVSMMYHIFYVFFQLINGSINIIVYNYVCVCALCPLKVKNPKGITTRNGKSAHKVTVVCPLKAIWAQNF